MGSIADPMFTTPQAREYLGVSDDVLKKKRARGDIRFYRHGPKTVTYRRSELDRYLESIARGGRV